MFDQWKVLHLDEVEAESILFSRALAHERFAGRCEAVRSFGDAKISLERALYAPQSFSRPDIIVVNWHPDCDRRVLEFVHWIRFQPQLRATAIIVFITPQLTLAARERAQHEGVTEVIARPDTFEDLLWQVRALLERCVNRYAMRQPLSGN